MSKERNDKIDELIKLDQKRKKSKVQKDKLTLREYLALLQDRPEIAQFSHSRLYTMIMSEGFKNVSESDAEFFDVKREFNFFEKHLKGVKSQFSEIMEVFKAGSQDLPIGKKIILLFGPPSSGKSSFMEALKTGLSNYRDVPLYKIEGCPINEEPLHLIPENMRAEFVKLLKVEIKGDLCPKCVAKLDEYKKKHGEVGYYNIPVEQFHISRRRMKGIGRFAPADDKTQDASDVTAKENPAVTYNPNRGYEDPDAFTLNGAIPRGNRGIVEGVEFVKKGIDTRILWAFIDLNEEGFLSVPGSNMPPIDIDTVVIGHCNIIGFKWFVNDPAHEGVQSRIHGIPFPYVIRARHEVEIYRKLFNQAKHRDLGIHIAPGTLELVALFAVTTRLAPDGDFGSLLEKAKYLDGHIVESAVDKMLNIRSVLAKGQSNDDWSKKDGMFGISSRDIMSALSKAFVSEKGCKCLTPKKAMSFIFSNFNNMPTVSSEAIKSYKNLILTEMEWEYKKNIIEIVNNAFLSSSDLALKKAKNYLANVKLYCQKTRKLVDQPVTPENSREPDYEYLTRVEKYMGFTTHEAAVSARGEFHQMYLEYLDEHGELDLNDFPKLKDAISKVLLEEMETNMLDILTLPSNGKDAENAKQYHDDLVRGLKKAGYCDDCAPEVMSDARRFLKR
jgi:serine protein kinase